MSSARKLLSRCGIALAALGLLLPALGGSAEGRTTGHGAAMKRAGCCCPTVSASGCCCEPVAVSLSSASGASRSTALAPVADRSETRTIESGGWCGCRANAPAAPARRPAQHQQSEGRAGGESLAFAVLASDSNIAAGRVRLARQPALALHCPKHPLYLLVAHLLI